MLIDRLLPRFDVTQVVEASVNATPAQTFAAIRDVDLRDPFVNLLFFVRELPQRLLRWWRGTPPPAARGKLTFRTLTQSGPGWTLLAEEPGVEFVVGSVGRFWRKDYGARPVTAAEFPEFHEPGFAKLALGFAVRPTPGGGAILRYEARTSTTDPAARRTFGRYWRLIRPGVALIMGRVVRRIKAAAELGLPVPVA
jgi:hypothetical protein